MNLVQIGRHVIDVDRVRNIEFGIDSQGRLYGAVHWDSGWERFEGAAECAMLQRWINTVATYQDLRARFDIPAQIEGGA